MMKQLIGHDVGSMVFDASAQTLTFSGVTLTQEQILTVVNATDGIMIYCFADPSLKGTLAGSVLTVDYNTTGMDDGDAIQIYVDLPDVVQAVTGPLTNAELLASPDIAELISELRVISSLLLNPPNMDPTVNAIRSTITSLPTLATVTTVAALTALNSFNLDPVVRDLSILSWAANVRWRMT
jgi:hypothetical protein